MKFKKIFIVSIFLLIILSLSSVSAADNSTDKNVQTISENTEDISDSSAKEVVLERDMNYQTNKIKSSSKTEDDALKISDSNKNQVKSISSDSFNVGVPENIEVWGPNTYLHMNFSLPKNSKGKVSLYKDNYLIKTFDLSDEELISSILPRECNIYIETTKKKDIYHVDYNLNGTSIGIRNFTFKYENGGDVLEKSGLVNITYILKPASEKIVYSDKSLMIITPINIKGKVSVEIDGKKYNTYIKTYKSHYIRCVVLNTKNQYVKLSPKLSIGKHKIKIIYPGDELYPSRSVEYELTVVPRILINAFYGDSKKKISLELPKNAKGKLVLKFYDSKKKLVKTFTKKLRNGKAIIIIPKKFYGKFSKVVAKYSGHDYKVPKEVMKDIIIDPPISVPKTMLQGEKKFVSIKLRGKKGVLKLYMYTYSDDEDTKEKVYTKRLVKGKAKISLSRFTDKNDINYIEFVETLKNGKKVTYNVYKSCSIFKPLYITHDKLYQGNAEIRIQAYKKGGKILKNKRITIKINGKFIKKVKTNKYGYVDFKIPKKYKPKKYRLTVKYKKNSLTERIRIYKATKKSKKSKRKPKWTYVNRTC